MVHPNSFTAWDEGVQGVKNGRGSAGNRQGGAESGGAGDDIVQRWEVSLIPRPSPPSISDNVGGGLVNWVMCSDVPGLWRSRTFLLYSCKVAFWTQEKLPRLSDVKYTQSFYNPCLQSVVLFPGMCHSSHVQVCNCMWLSFTGPPPELATRDGVHL